VDGVAPQLFFRDKGPRGAYPERRTLSLDLSRTCHSHILCAAGVDEMFGLIVVDIPAAEKGRTRFKIKCDVGLENDGAAEICARTEIDDASAGGRACVYRPGRDVQARK